MYNKKTAKNKITKKYNLLTYYVYYLQHFAPKISLPSKRKSVLN